MPTTQLCHLVAYRLAEGLAPEKMARIEALFAACGKDIPEILSLEFGRNLSESRFARGWEFGAVMTFAGPAERDRFLAHPTHTALSVAAADGFYREMVVFELPVPMADAEASA